MIPRPSRYNSPMPAAKKRRVLFVCVGNACRSPMAEAVSRQLVSDIIEPSSAGLYPLGHLAEVTEHTLLANGYPLDGLCSKPLRREALEQADVIINMTGQSLDGLLANYRSADNGAYPLAQKVENWNIKDPYGEEPAAYQRILIELEGRVLLLARRLRAAQRATHS